MLSSSENQIQSDSSQYWKIWTPEVCSCFWKCKPLNAKSHFKDTAIVLKAAYFCIKPLEGIHKCGGWTLHPYSFSVVSANSPSLTSQHWWLGMEGIAGQSGIGLHSEPEVALAETRENKGCCWILPRTQNPATICPYGVSVSRMWKVLLYLHSQLNMILTWLWCWCCYIFSAWWFLALFVPAYCSWDTLSLQWSENKVFWKLFSAVIWWTSYGFFCKEGRRKGGKEERDNRRDKSQSLTEDCSRANNKHNKYSYQSRRLVHGKETCSQQEWALSINWWFTVVSN